MKSTVATMLLLLLGLLVPAAAAAAVPNDDQATAKEIVGPFPSFDMVDLSEATTSAEEILLCDGFQQNAA